MKKNPIILLLLLIFPCLYTQEWNPYLAGLAEMIRAEYDSAIIQFSSAIALNNRNSSYYLKRASCYYELKEYRKAVTDLKKAEQFKKGIGSYLLSQSYAMLNEEDSSLFWLTEHLNSSFKLPESTIKLDPAFTHLEESREWLDVWKKDWYSEFENILAEINYLIKKENYVDALNYTDQYLPEYNHRHQMHAARGIIFYHLKNFNTAISAFTTAIELNSTESSYYQYRSDAYMQTGKQDKALIDIDKAIRMDPDDLPLYLKRSQIENITGDYEDAIKDAGFYYTYFPEDEQVIYLFGQIYFNQGKYLKALEWFNKCLNLNSFIPEYFIARGNTYLKTKTYKYAIRDYSMALDLEPDNPGVYLNKGIARLYLQDINGACIDWEKAVHYGSLEAGEYIDKYCRMNK